MSVFIRRGNFFIRANFLLQSAQRRDHVNTQQAKRRSLRIKSTLNLGFSASSTVRNKSLFLSHSVFGILLWYLKQTKTGSLHSSFCLILVILQCLQKQSYECFATLYNCYLHKAQSDRAIPLLLEVRSLFFLITVLLIEKSCFKNI